MEKIIDLERFFKDFIAIDKKNLNRKERSFYLLKLENLLSLSPKGSSAVSELINIPEESLELFFKKTCILDRNYRKKYKTVFECYEHFIKHRKEYTKITSLADKKEVKLSNKKFIKKINSFINKGEDDLIINNIFDRDFSIKQLLKLYHILNIKLISNDYRKSILLNVVSDRLNDLISKYAKKSDVGKIKGVDDIYPIDKHCDNINYVYLKHTELSEPNYKDKRIKIQVIEGGTMESINFFLAQKNGLEKCTLFNCNIPIYYSTSEYGQATVKDIKNTFKDGTFLVVNFTINPTVTKGCNISLTVNKSFLSTDINLNLKACKKTTWFFIYNPIKGTYMLFENLPRFVFNVKLNILNCNRLFQLFKDSKLSLSEIFSRDNLSGNISNIEELMNKNK